MGAAGAVSTVRHLVHCTLGWPSSGSGPCETHLCTCNLRARRTTPPLLTFFTVRCRGATALIRHSTASCQSNADVGLVRNPPRAKTGCGGGNGANTGGFSGGCEPKVLCRGAPGGGAPAGSPLPRRVPGSRAKARTGRTRGTRAVQWRNARRPPQGGPPCGFATETGAVSWQPPAGELASLRHRRRATASPPRTPPRDPS